MPESKTRRKPAPRRKSAAHAAEAEATNGELGFTFRGHRFVIDYATADFGRAMFAYRIAANGGNVATQFERLIDCLEAVLGQEQVASLYELASDLFSSETAQREFWEAFGKQTVGADVGESSAS